MRHYKDEASQAGAEAAHAAVEKYAKEFHKIGKALQYKSTVETSKTSATLMSSLREMIKAEVEHDSEQYSRHETVVREELEELFKRVTHLANRHRNIQPYTPFWKIKLK